MTWSSIDYQGDNVAKKNWFEVTPRVAGIAAVALVFALVLSGCDGELTAGAVGYTFKFKVENKYSTGATITKVVFFNGTNRSSSVLRSLYGFNLTPGELSDEYKVSGFTKQYGINERLCGVLITYEDGTDIFCYGYYEHESKILVTSTYDWSGRKIELSAGAW
jgi:hypothetical protein